MTFETLLKNILKDLKGIIILGMLMIVNVPKPIIKTKIIKKNVIKPMKKDFTICIIKLNLKNHSSLRIFQYDIYCYQIFVLQL